MHEKRNAGSSTRQQSCVPVHADPERDEQRRRHERLRVLEAIQRHGDRAAFQKAAELKRWLSPKSSSASVSS